MTGLPVRWLLGAVFALAVHGGARAETGRERGAAYLEPRTVDAPFNDVQHMVYGAATPKCRRRSTDESRPMSRPAQAPDRCLLRRAGPPGTCLDLHLQVDDRRLTDVVDPAAALHVLYDQAVHSEGPVWEAARQRLIFSDVTGRRLLAWYPDGHVEVVIDATPFINGNALDSDGRLVHCEHLRRCISRSPAGDGRPEPLVTHFEGKRLNTPNDVNVAADGAIWFTDPTFGLIMPQQGCLAEPELDHRSVYRYEAVTCELRRMADFDQPNGLFFTPDGRTLYVSDTSRSIGGPTHEIVAFDIGDDGTLANRRFFCRADHGVPDGFLVDSRGWLWSTAGDGLHIYDAAAVKLGYLPTPATASNLALGGPNGRTLFITAEQMLLSIELASA